MKYPFFCYYISKNCLWFRFKGYGLNFKSSPKTFSERNNLIFYIQLPFGLRISILKPDSENIKDFIDQRYKLFKKLKKENADCSEFLANGFLRISEKDKKKCDCLQCLEFRKNKKDLHQLH